MDMPEPENKPQQDPSKKGAKSSWVEIEGLVQLGFMFPAAIFIGWVVGTLLDHWLHTHWIYIAGIVLGSVAAFVKLIMFALDPKNQK